MDSLSQTVQRVVEGKAEELAKADSEQQVEELAKEIARQVDREYDPRSDPWTYRGVIFVLGLVLVIVSITYAWYTMTPDQIDVSRRTVTKLRDLPDALIALGSAAIGALAGLLAPTPRK